MLEQGTPYEENKNMKVIGEAIVPIEHVENEGISKSVDGSKEVESTTDAGGPGVVSSAENQELVVEQDSINSSTSSSPNSVLPNETLRGQISSSDFYQQGVIQSDTEIILRAITLDEDPPENLILNMSGTPSVRESLDQQSVDDNSKKSQERQSWMP